MIYRILIQEISLLLHLQNKLWFNIKAQTRDHNINTHKLDQYQQVDLQPIDPLRQQQQQQLNDKIVVPPVSSSSPLPPSSPIGNKNDLMIKSIVQILGNSMVVISQNEEN